MVPEFGTQREQSFQSLLGCASRIDKIVRVIDLLYNNGFIQFKIISGKIPGELFPTLSAKADFVTNSFFSIQAVVVVSRGGSYLRQRRRRKSLADASIHREKVIDFFQQGDPGGKYRIITSFLGDRWSRKDAVECVLQEIPASTQCQINILWQIDFCLDKKE